jgi:hypothetical protein
MYVGGRKAQQNAQMRFSEQAVDRPGEKQEETYAYEITQKGKYF